MAQPKWRYVDNLADVNFIDYGGFLIFRDATGVYPPEVELIEVIDDGDEDDMEWRVYRFRLEPHTFFNGVLSDNPYHPAHPVWYADKLASAAQCSGVSEDELRNQLLSADPVKRAIGYQILIGYFGPDEFDSYHLEFTRRAEVNARYRSVERTIERRRKARVSP